MSGIDGSPPESSRGGRNDFKRFVKAKPEGVDQGQSPFIGPIIDAEITPIQPHSETDNNATPDSVQSSPLDAQPFDHDSSPAASSAQSDSSAKVNGVDPDYSTWSVKQDQNDSQSSDLASQSEISADSNADTENDSVKELFMRALEEGKKIESERLAAGVAEVESSPESEAVLQEMMNDVEGMSREERMEWMGTLLGMEQARIAALLKSGDMEAAYERITEIDDMFKAESARRKELEQAAIDPSTGVSSERVFEEQVLQEGVENAEAIESLPGSSRVFDTTMSEASDKSDEVLDEQSMSAEHISSIRELRAVTKEGSPERAQLDAMLEGYSEREPTYEEIEKVFLGAHTESWNTLSERLRAAGFDHGQQEMLRKGIIEATHKNKDKAEEITKALKDRMSQLTDENRELLSEHLDRQRHVKMTGGEYKGVKGTKRKVTTSDGTVVTILESAPIDPLLDSLNDEWKILENKTRSPEEEERLTYVKATCKTLIRNHRAYIDRKFRVRDGDVRRAVNSDDVFAAVVEDDRQVWSERFPGADRMRSDNDADRRVAFRFELKMPKKPTTRKPSTKPIGTIGKPPEPPEPPIVTGPKPPTPTGSIDTGIGKPPKPPTGPIGDPPEPPTSEPPIRPGPPKPPVAPPFVPAGAGSLGKINFGQFDDSSYGEKGPGDEHMTEEDLIRRKLAREKWKKEEDKDVKPIGWFRRNAKKFAWGGGATVLGLVGIAGLDQIREGNNANTTNTGTPSPTLVVGGEMSSATSSPDYKIVDNGGYGTAQTETVTSEPAETPTLTNIPTEESTETSTPTETPSPTETATVSPTATATETETSTPEPTETIEATVTATETSEGEARTANETSIVEHVDELMDNAQLVTVTDGSYISLEMQEDGIMPGGEFNLEVYQKPTELGGLILINWDAYENSWKVAKEKGRFEGGIPSYEQIVQWIDEGDMTNLKRVADIHEPGVYIVFDNRDGKNFDDEFYNSGEFAKQMVYSGNFSIYQEEVETRKQEMIKKIENDNKEKYAAVVAKNALNAADAEGVLSTSKPS